MDDTTIMIRYYSRNFPDDHPIIIAFKNGVFKSHLRAIDAMVYEAYPVFNCYSFAQLRKAANIYMVKKRLDFSKPQERQS